MAQYDDTPASPVDTPSAGGPETIWDNVRWSPHRGEISVVIPTYKDDAAPLITALAACKDADRIEIIVYDDGGGDEALWHVIQEAAAIAMCPVRLVAAARNAGRACARNRLISHARSDWILLLDADMLPDSEDFLSVYLAHVEQATEPGLCVGGFSLKSAPTDTKYALHRWQSLASECVPAHIRNTHPGRYVFTSNVLAHRSILSRFPFDESFSGWGWEDVDWGLRTAAEAPVVHLDNTATHLGLDTADTLMRKYGASGENFARILEKHPEALSETPLVKAAMALRKLPLRPMLTSLAAGAARTSFPLVPVSMRGRALKLWRALVYAEALS